jgi:hypothetical protein
MTRSTTRQADAGNRAAAHAVAAELNDVLRRVGAQNQTPSASAVRAASQERAKSRPPARGTATAGRQPPVSAAAGTVRGNVGALRATGVTPTSTRTTAARTAVNNGAPSVTPRSAPAAVGGLGGIRASLAASTQSAAASPAVVRGNGGTVPLVPADAGDRARRGLNVLSQHADDAELDRVLRQFQQEQANAASQQASKDASADVVKENEDLRRQLATLSMLLSEQMTQRAPLNVADNADDVIDVGTVSDATDTDDGRAARGRADSRQASQRAATRNNSPASRARQPRRVAFVSDGQASADTSDADSVTLSTRAANGSVTYKAKSTKQPAAVKAGQGRQQSNGSQSNGADGQGHKRQPPKPNGQRGNGGGDGGGGDPSSSEDWSDDDDDDSYDHSSDDDDGRRSRRRRQGYVRSDVKPNTFNGDGYVEQFLAQFKYTARLARWPKSEWGLRMIHALEGKARRIISDDYLPAGKPDYQHVKKLLRESFGSEATPDVWRTTLENRRRYKKETLTDLSQAISELVSRAYPEVSFEQRSRLAVSHFARALNVKQHSVHVMALCPKTLNDALQMALAFENAEKMVGDNKSYSVMAYGDEDDQKLAAAHQCQSKGKGGKRKKGGKGRDDCTPVAQPASPTPRGNGSKQSQGQGQPSNTSTDDVEWKSMMMSQINALHSQLQQMTGNRPHTSQSNEQRLTAAPVQAQGWSYTCYNCGEEGHFQRNCPHPRKQRSGWARQENGQGRGGNGHPHGQGQQ